MPTIDAYSFGHMTVDGKSYRSDVIIYPDDSILYPWWRGSGHRLEIPDIKTLIDMQPDIIITGTGANGLMVPARELPGILQKRDIKFIALPTGEAIKMFNKRAKTMRTGGCFHITC